MLDVSDIHLIKTIADIGSVNKAADVLHTSQPTLSKRLSRLEQVLNITLFHRNTAGMIPTEIAKYIISSGEPLKSQLRVIERQVELMSNLSSGSLHIGVGPIIEQLYFPKVILDLVEETEKINLSLRTESADRLLNLLTSGEVDVAIGPFDAEELDDELMVLPVKTSKIILVARTDHPIFNEGRDFSIQKIMAYPSIAPSIPSQFLKWFDHMEVSGIPQIACDNYVTSRSVVMSSDYISGGPELVFRKEIESGELKEIPLSFDVNWSSYCVTRPEAMHVPVVKKFIEILERYTDDSLLVN